MKKKNKKHPARTVSVKKEKIKTKRSAPPEVKGFFILIFAIILIISLYSFAYRPGSTNILGLVGETLGSIFHSLFGVSSYVICIFIGWIGWRLLFLKSINHIFRKTFYTFLLTTSMSILLSLIEDRNLELGRALGKTFYTSLWENKMRYHLGGAPFFYIYHDLPTFNLYRIFNSYGTGIIFSGTFVASIMFLSKISPRALIEKLRLINFASDEIQPKYQDTLILDAAVEVQEVDKSRFVKLRTSQSESNSIVKRNSENDDMLEIHPETNLKERPSVSRKNLDKNGPSFPFDLPAKKEEAKIEQPPTLAITAQFQTPSQPTSDAKKLIQKRLKALESQSLYNGDFSKYKLPDLTLLTNPKKVDQSSLKVNLRRQAEVLEETLQSFGIEAKVGQINCGPSINSFEVHPAIGVKVQKIKTLENDIALNMEAKSIRIIAPIPGKAAVGIEIPNPQPQEVGFKDMLAAYQQAPKKFHIPILLGKAVNGDYVMSDLTKMPHCIIAGATGSGKSVCINTIVMSILMTARPDEIKLIMVDPKKVELTAYSRLPHMLAPVITEPQGACAALMWLVKEMESRYDILKLTGVRNIDSFNNRKIDKEIEEKLGKEIPEKMHYIVAIIDELADLMMVSSNDIETPIARIAQMARAVGIHLILATQRPSREVITGLIKANFPTRISFKVASRVNSQIILDEVGAETLLGNGDMLFLPPGTSHLTRAQGAFIRDEDINKVVKMICEQAPPNYVIQSFDTMTELQDLNLDDKPSTPKDNLYNEAVGIVMNAGNASTTYLQRKLKIGYARAASLMDELETNGIISAADGSKQRRILAKDQNTIETKEPFLGTALPDINDDDEEDME